MEHLPEAVRRGNFKPVATEKKSTFITFDLETTDFGYINNLIDNLPYQRILFLFS